MDTEETKTDQQSVAQEIVGDRSRPDTNLSIHLRLVLAGALSTFLGIGLVSYFLIDQQSKVLRQEVRHSTNELRTALAERGDLIADSLTSSMENAIAGYNLSFVGESLNSLAASDANLSYGYVTNSVDTVIVHTDTSVVGTTRTAKEPEQSSAAQPYRVVKQDDGLRVLEIDRTLTIGDKHWGNLTLGFDLRSFRYRTMIAHARGRKLIAEATLMSIGIGLIAILFGVAASIALSRRLLAPIRRLADDASAISAGDLDHEIRAVNSSDEIGFLARQFELMRVSIRGYVDELVVSKETAEAATRQEQKLREQIQKHSRTLEAKVHERTAELQEINARLAENDRLKSEFLSNVSHELRSPLAAISSAAKIIGRYGDENKRTGQRFSDVIKNESERLGRLINDLLDLAKIEAGKVEWHMEELGDPVELFAHVVTTFKPLAEESEIDFSLDCKASLNPLHGDRDRLIQVLTNLCSNAMKFTPSGGSIILSAEQGEKNGQPVLFVAIDDTGPGIPDEELGKVFDRFHQVKQRTSNKDKPKGTGLGLAICREVVNHHGGGDLGRSRPNWRMPNGILPAV